MLRSRRGCRCAGVKSSPTTATRRTGAKNDAATAKCAADPPSASRTSPNGVLTVSNATEPTTRMDTSCAPRGQVFVEEDAEARPRVRRDRVYGRDDRVRERFAAP